MFKCRKSFFESPGGSVLNYRGLYVGEGCFLRLKVHRGLDATLSYVDLKEGARIHVLGICGTAMSSLAGLLKLKGYRISGSDNRFYPPVSEELKRLDVQVVEGYEATHIHKDLDLVIVGNVIRKIMPVSQALLHSQIPYVSLPEALNQLVIQRKKHCIMVTGTHGKTTISFLVAWLLHYCGLDPGFPDRWCGS